MCFPKRLHHKWTLIIDVFSLERIKSGPKVWRLMRHFKVICPRPNVATSIFEDLSDMPMLIFYGIPDAQSAVGSSCCSDNNFTTPFGFWTSSCCTSRKYCELYFDRRQKSTVCVFNDKVNAIDAVEGKLLIRLKFRFKIEFKILSMTISASKQFVDRDLVTDNS